MGATNQTPALFLIVFLAACGESGEQALVESVPDAALDVGSEARPVAEGQIFINEIVCKAEGDGPDWLELYAAGDGPVRLADYTIVDGSDSHSPERLPDLTLQPGEFFTVEAGGDGDASVSFKLGSSDGIWLTRGQNVVDALTWEDGDAPEGTSWGRLPDGDGEPRRLTPTPGAANVAWVEPPPDCDAFPEGRVIDVSLELSEAAWQAILDDPLAEEYQTGNIVYEGERVDDVAIRVKGNSSLKSIAQQDSERFSFKVDINRVVSGQRLCGVKKLNFSNGFKDPSLIREHLAYELARGLGIPASRTAFVDLTVAGTHMGLYTVVEQVDDLFLEARFADGDGDLYKPEPPSGTLVWRGDSYDDYPTMEPESNEETTDHAALLEMLAVLDHGEPSAYPQVLDTAEIIRYLALNAALTNLDSYNGTGHNYYLYEQDGVFSVIPWDLNEAFGNFTCGCDRAGVLGFLVDEPTCGDLAERPLIARLLAVPEHLETYHAVLRALVEGPLSPATMSARIAEVADLIRPYVEADPTKFYTTEEFEAALTDGVVADAGPTGGVGLGLEEFVASRTTNVLSQLDGTLPSAGDGSGSCEGTGGPIGPGPNPDKCPDGVCDAAEQANPQLCPVDCQ